MEKFHRNARTAVFLSACAMFIWTAMAKPEGDRVIAIDVLLLPDSTTVDKAKEANALLRTNYPKGYTLGGDQTAHITLVHSYVHEKDLPQIQAAVAKVSAEASPLD